MSSEPSPYGGLAEATVVGRAQDGDLAAFELLVRHYQAPLFRLAVRMLNDRGEAEDAVQDAALLIWRKLPLLEDPTVFRSWAYRIMTRRCLSVSRGHQRRATAPVAGEELADLIAGSEPAAADPARTVQATEELTALHQLLDQLPEDQRACWVLRELHGLSYPEIGYATNLPVSTVRGALARARSSLMKGMQPWR